MKHISIEELEVALNTRDLFINPDLLEYAADEIDCGCECDTYWREFDTNASGCKASEKGEYCQNDLAETLRELAKLARKSPDIAPFIVTFDGGKTITQTLTDVYKWRDWSPRESQLIREVYDGKVRRFSTSKNGVYCDIERREA
jgi:hypothetical protein